MLSIKNYQEWLFSVRFGFYQKKVTKLKFKKKTKIGSNRPISVRFGFFITKSFKPVWLGFLDLARLFRFGSVFSSLAQFFSVWVRFGFFGFRLIKSNPNRTGQFFQNSNWFFFTVRFFCYFFIGFLGLIGFGFFAHP
jgi:hypothetical protein